jgi:hypothetical protein
MSDELWLAVIQAAASILTVAITVLVPLILNTLRKKYGQEIAANKDAQIEHAAREAVLFVKELAAAKLKAQVLPMQPPPPGAMTPAEKLSTAISSVVEAKPELSRDEAHRKVVVAMAQVGEGAAANPQPAPGS